MNNVIVRALSGIVYIALIVGSILGGEVYFFLLTTLFSVIGMYEFSQMVHIGDRFESSYLRVTAIDCLFSAFVPLLAFLSDPATLYLTVLITYFLVRATIGLNDLRDHAFREVMKSITGLIYVSTPLLTLNLLYSSGEKMHELVLLMFVMIWLNDTGAFCVGSLLGHRKLCQRLSPKKSWEGFWGGMICCVIFSVVCYNYNSLNLNIGCLEWVVLGIVISLMSTWGDLFESLLKRTVKVKDSGKLIPGHGGILDRIDSLLFVGPTTYIFMQLIAG
ncbi:MAG: phosphatidate cytidylyltransferase [Muribaculaceae bacterium]|nr:phosphatidate cytidylyltransferase [Muribaculaceae bacterium]